MIGYAITDFEMKVGTEGEFEVGGETGWNEGHPKLHGCILGISFGPGCIYDLNPLPPSPNLTLGWDRSI